MIVNRLGSIDLYLFTILSSRLLCKKKNGDLAIGWVGKILQFLFGQWIHFLNGEFGIGAIQDSLGNVAIGTNRI